MSVQEPSDSTRLHMRSQVRVRPVYGGEERRYALAAETVATETGRAKQFSMQVRADSTDASTALLLLLLLMSIENPSRVRVFS